MLTSAAEPLLSVKALESGYGKIRVLHGIDVENGHAGPPAVAGGAAVTNPT